MALRVLETESCKENEILSNKNRKKTLLRILFKNQFIFPIILFKNTHLRQLYKSRKKITKIQIHSHGHLGFFPTQKHGNALYRNTFKYIKTSLYYLVIYFWCYLLYFISFSCIFEFLGAERAAVPSEPLLVLKPWFNNVDYVRRGRARVRERAFYGQTGALFAL